MKIIITLGLLILLHISIGSLSDADDFSVVFGILGIVFAFTGIYYTYKKSINNFINNLKK